MPANPNTRREFLKSLLVAASAAALQPWRWAGTLLETRAHPASGHLLAALSNRESAAVIGAAFLRSAPGESDARRLADSLLDGLNAEKRMANAAVLRKHLQMQQRRDFAEGRTVEVAGWMLSRTEARLCALAHLSS